jgi:hypothetical protein
VQILPARLIVTSGGVIRMRLFIRQGSAACLLLFGIIGTSGAENPSSQQMPGANISNGTLPSVLQARSLGMLSQVVMQLEHHVQSKDLGAIHNEDVILGAVASELVAQADAIAPNQSGDFRSSLTAFCSRVSVLHLVANLEPTGRMAFTIRSLRPPDRAMRGHVVNLRLRWHPQAALKSRSLLSSGPCRERREMNTAIQR